MSSQWIMSLAVASAGAIILSWVLFDEGYDIGSLVVFVLGFVGLLTSAVLRPKP